MELSSIVSLLATGLVLIHARIEWTPSVEAAVQRASREACVVFLAVNMDHERANDTTAEELYRDPDIVERTRDTVNVVANRYEHRRGMVDCARFGGIPCAAHRRVDVELRERGYVIPNPQGRVVAPQHTFLAPDGRVLLSVPYFVEKEELLWCFYEAQRLLGAEVEVPPHCRPPERLLRGRVHNPNAPPPPPPTPGREEILERVRALDEAARTRPLEEEELRGLLPFDEPEAIELVRRHLPDLPERTLPDLVHDIGVTAAVSWVRAILPLARHDAAAVRNAAALALEELGIRGEPVPDAPAARDAIRAALRRERDSQAKKNWIRALGAHTAGDGDARTDLLRYAGSTRAALLRRNALVALGRAEPHDRIRAALSRALGDDDPRIRAAAACAVALSRDAELGEAVSEALGREEDRDARHALRGAETVLGGGEFADLAEVIGQVAEDRVRRAR